MWNSFHWLLVLLLLDSALAVRKVKRKENYQSAAYLPEEGQIQSSGPAINGGEESAPYQFENPNEYDLSPPPLSPQHHRNYHNHHSPIQRYEKDLITFPSDGKGSSNFLIDNGLRSIAKGSADQALGAVASQAAAGKQAAYVAQSTLAQAAAQAASTAVAALKGKEVLLHRLEEQSAEAHKALENELAQLQQAKRSAKTAQYAAQQAINHVSVLTAALNNAQSASELAQKSASEAAAELASQIDMVAQAKTKLEQVEGHAYAARLDYEETKEAAEKATLSAQEAQINANDAAAHANVELNVPGGNVHGLHDKSDSLLSQATSIKETKRDLPNRTRNRRRNHKKN